MDRKQKMELVIVVFLVIVVVLYYAMPEIRSITETIMKTFAIIIGVCVFMKVDSWFGGKGGNSCVDTWDNGDDCDCDGDCDCD